MELVCLTHHNVLANTKNGEILFLTDPKDITTLLKDHTKTQVVISFAEVETDKSNREVLVCDWPGEYERNETTILGLKPGCFLVSMEGRNWLCVSDSALENLEKDIEQLSAVDGVMVWLTDPKNKTHIQKFLDHAEPTFLVYITDKTTIPLAQELVPPLATAPVSTLTVKPSELSAEAEHITVHALQE
ncbi:MAG: hypothetical protein A2V81_04915 [Candidatus Abawacabacteria bacterium RBG_16_42_10]|uniref:Uncharacterized protein n=1 Tax=Candidatus Abawacabacteria bacterium RBG_16_42_10 TaxID=1817814 RepID=A0A1F4XIZ5_9BACT|nr:MAG: hypothetical protein A2V81_04915 [Candidatus Abawacabacteria bacterium RBG_16_42_10]